MFTGFFSKKLKTLKIIQHRKWKTSRLKITENNKHRNYVKNRDNKKMNNFVIVCNC